MSTKHISRSSNPCSLNGKRILITGASRGLGAVCAMDFARQGAHLALMARTVPLLETVCRNCRPSDQHLAVPVDLTDMERLPEAVHRAVDFLGGLDAVLHVAGGGLGFRDPFPEAGDFLKLFTLNVVAAAQINRLVVPGMIQRGKGNLVHVGSISGAEANASVGYNTVKSALSAYVRSIGNELAGSNIVATGILPGGFYAPGNSWERLQAQQPGVVAQFVHRRLPRKRLAAAEELIPLLGFLCSDAASMMAGCMVPIDAGEGKAYVHV